MQKDLDQIKKEKVDAAIAGLELTRKEESFINWLMDIELESVESFSSIVGKAKQAGDREA